MAGRIDADDAAPEQAGPDRGKPRPHFVIPADRPRTSGQGQHPLRACREGAGAAQRGIERPHVLGSQLDVGVHVQPGKSLATRSPARRASCLEATGTGSTRTAGPNDEATLAVSSVHPVGDDDDVKLSGPRIGDQLAEQPSYDACLVVRWNDDGRHTRQMWTALGHRAIGYGEET